MTLCRVTLAADHRHTRSRCAAQKPPHSLREHWRRRESVVAHMTFFVVETGAVRSSTEFATKEDVLNSALSKAARQRFAVELWAEPGER